MRFIFLGVPGSGKGTYAIRLSEAKDIPHISAGDLLRDNRDHPIHSKAIRHALDKGDLVDVKIIADFISERISKDDCKSGFILDGFPRELDQARFLEERGIRIDKVVFMDASEEIILHRLSGRRICKNCKKTYNLNTNLAPEKEGICDDCGGGIYQREDDKEETIKKRFEVYEKETKPVIDYFESKGIVFRHNANQEVSEAFDMFLQNLYKDES